MVMENEWREFSKMIPPSASDEQVYGMRIAFFGGAASAVMCIKEAKDQTVVGDAIVEASLVEMTKYIDAHQRH